jgi:gluconate 5-dehydrogenase
MFELDEKIAVVIGGGGGLGESCARALATQKASVIIASRNQEKLEPLAQTMQTDTGSLVEAMPVDVTNEESVEKLSEMVLEKHGTVDILVNAHGYTVRQPSVEIDLDTWDALFETNVRGVILPCRVFGKTMMEKKKGKIINLSSVRGVRGAKNGNTIYGASKGAVDMITRMLAVEWAEFNINVNAIGPSLVLTELIVNGVPKKRLEQLREGMLFKRFCPPEEVGAACVYLAAPESDYITGQIIYVDGGLTAFA